MQKVSVLELKKAHVYDEIVKRELMQKELQALNENIAKHAQEISNFKEAIDDAGCDNSKRKSSER